MKTEAAGLISSTKTTGPSTRKKKGTSYPATTGPLRRLTITSKSTKLGRLDIRMKALGFDTLVRNMQEYRSKGHTADWLIQMTYADGDPPVETRAQKLQYLAEGSPTLRYIISQVHEYILQPKDTRRRPDKLLIAEDTLLVAWFWD